MATTTKSDVSIVIEIGAKKTFASAIDWPGWCRSGKNADAAMDNLVAYTDRYNSFLKFAGLRALPKTFNDHVDETVKGNATTDFGAPGIVADSYNKPGTAKDFAALAQFVNAAWRYLDDVANHAPEGLAKGPRGGGRDTSAIVTHVAEPEFAYARKMGIVTKAVTDVRPLIEDFVRSGATYELGSTPWPPRYAAMRVVWHALDHAWEIQDRS